MSYSTFNSDSSNLETSGLQQPQIQQTQIPTQSQQILQQNNNTSNHKQLTLHEKIHVFLISKTGTIIAYAFGIAIGFAIKDLVSSIVVNLLKPLFALFFTMTHLENYYDFNSIISPENNALNLSSFVTSLITFILVIIVVYFISLNYQ
jgi:large-conductance mechanosensitive channel